MPEVFNARHRNIGSNCIIKVFVADFCKLKPHAIAAHSQDCVLAKPGFWLSLSDNTTLAEAL